MTTIREEPARTTIVDRDDVLNIIGLKIKNIRHEMKHDKEHILSFFGVAGIGKTKLLEYLQSYYAEMQRDCVAISLDDVEAREKRSVAPCEQIHEPIPCASIDLLELTYQDHTLGYISLLTSIIDQLENHIAPSELNEFRASVDGFRHRASKQADFSDAPFNPEAEGAGITDQFQTIVEDLCNSHQVVLVLLDNSDKVSKIVFDQFKETLNLLRKETSFLVIFTANQAIEWEPSPVIAQYAKQHPMTLFPIAATYEQIAPHLDAAGEVVHKLTGGLPRANQRVLKKWLNLQGRYTPEEWVRRYDHTISRDLMKMVNDTILRQKDDDSELKDAFLKTSIARRFEVSLFSDLLRARCYPSRDTFDPGSAIQHMKLLRVMDETGLLDKEPESKRWGITPAVRRILSAYMRFNHLEAFRVLHELALQKNEEWISIADSGDRHLFIVEYLFHRALLLSCEEPYEENMKKQSIAQDLIDPLRNYLNIDGTDKEMLVSQLNRDTELSEIIDSKILIVEIDPESEETPAPVTSNDIDNGQLLSETEPLTSVIADDYESEESSNPVTSNETKPPTSVITPNLDNFKFSPSMLDKLSECFDQEELDTLCFKLEVDCENLGVKGKIPKIRELLKYLERRNRTLDLIDLVKIERPKVSWGEFLILEENSENQLPNIAPDNLDYEPHSEKG